MSHISVGLREILQTILIHVVKDAKPLEYFHTLFHHHALPSLTTILAMTPNLNQNMSPLLHYHGKAEGHGSAKFIFPGFLALPEIFQASGHLIPGPRIPFLGGCSQFGHQQSLPFCTRQVWYSFFVVSVALVKECGGLSQSSVCFNGLREILQTILIHVVKDASL